MSPTIPAVTTILGVKLYSNRREYSRFLGLPFVDPEDLDDADYEFRKLQVRDALASVLRFNGYLAHVDGITIAVFEDDSDITLAFGVQVDTDDNSMDFELLTFAQNSLNRAKRQITDPVLRDIFTNYPTAIHLIVREALVVLG